jgi:hypothetical protein
LFVTSFVCWVFLLALLDRGFMQPQIDNTTPAPRVPVNWGFIDRETYASLKESHKALSIDKFKNLCQKNSEVCKHLSESSNAYVILLNDRVNKVLFGYENGVRPSGLLNEHYLGEQLNTYLNEEVNNDDPFYEILPVDNENFLVVVGRGFLHHLTQSKDAALQYVLACLGCLDRFNCEASQLNELYLRLLYVQGYHLLIQARVQS